MSAHPTLPSELIACILDLAIPTLSFGTNSERTSLLKRLSLLSHDWLPFAQARLYTTILLQPAPDHFDEPDRSAQRLAATLAAHPELARLVQAIRFRKGRGKRGPSKVPAERLHMREILQHCGALAELSIVAVEGVELAWLGGQSSPRAYPPPMPSRNLTNVLPQAYDPLR